MTLQTGESKSDGGKVTDVWADFRFLQDGKVTFWDIIEHNRWWVFVLEGTGRARISIMPSSHFREFAVDAGLEFLDRLWERRVPKFIDTPDALMAMCAKAAIRQR